MKQREALIQEIEQLINETKLPFKDKVNAIAQVMIDMGVALEPELKKDLMIVSDLKMIEKAYYSDPTIAKALILEGAMMLTWEQ